MDIGITLTAFGGMMAGFFAIARIMLNQAAKDREADRKERENLSKAINLMAKSGDRVAKATEKSADEARERNGHLSEQSVQIATILNVQNKDIHDISTTLKTSVVTLAKETKAAALHVAEVKKDLADQ